MFLGDSNIDTRKKAQLVQTMRAFFVEREFVECFTPTLVPATDPEPHISTIPVQWDQFGYQQSGYLIPSPEFALKKILAHEDRIFEIAHVFRQEGLDTGRHATEFLMLEWYRRGAGYHVLMDDCETLVHQLLDVAGNTQGIARNGDLTANCRAPWKRISVSQLFRRHIGIDLDAHRTVASLHRICRAKGITTDTSDDYSDAFNRLFITYIEGELGVGVPTIVYDYPLPMAALARRKNMDSFFAERFELYVAGVEIANGFSELCDPQEQEKRFVTQNKDRMRAGLMPMPLDKEFLASLAEIKKAAGIALGVERLIRLLVAPNLGGDKAPPQTVSTAQKLGQNSRLKSSSSS